MTFEILFLGMGYYHLKEDVQLIKNSNISIQLKEFPHLPKKEFLQTHLLVSMKNILAHKYILISDT